MVVKSFLPCQEGWKVLFYYPLPYFRAFHPLNLGTFLCYLFQKYTWILAKVVT